MSPEILYGIGALILLAVLIYGTVQWRTRNKSQDSVTERATAQNYRAEERADDRGEG